MKSDCFVIGENGCGDQYAVLTSDPDAPVFIGGPHEGEYPKDNRGQLKKNLIEKAILDRNLLTQNISDVPVRAIDLNEPNCITEQSFVSCITAMNHGW